MPSVPDCPQRISAYPVLRELDPERLLDEGTKRGPGGNGPLLLTPLELLDRLTPLMPPPGPPSPLLRCAGAELAAAPRGCR